MSPATVLSRLRRFLLGLSALLCVGTLIELWLTEHMETAVQMIPFGLCALGLIAALVALLKPRRGWLIGMRLCMGLVALGGLYGVYEHMDNNIGFQREIHPTAPARQLLLDAFYGPNPLLAPGILTVAAALAVAATYRHPALTRTLPDLGEAIPEAGAR